MLYSIGINDADYKVRPTINGREVMCPVYQTWSNMLMRCYSEKYHLRQPTYVGCVVEPKWRVFSVFRRWMIEQDWKGNHLDKDIVGNGELYSSETCVFIPQWLNNFVNTRPASRGKLPLGVTLDRGWYLAQLGTRDKHMNLGRFRNVADAHAAFVTEKTKLSRQYASEQTDARIRDGLLRFASMLESQSMEVAV